jgi:hypothetical protein
MRDGTAAVIEAVRDVIWRGHANRSGLALSERNESVATLRAWMRRSRADREADAAADPALAALLRTVERVAWASWANRVGPRYAERRQYVAECRGALEAWDRG